jgi:hypothetical protein
MGTTKKPATTEHVTLTLSHAEATNLLTVLTHALQHGGTKTATAARTKSKLK